MIDSADLLKASVVLDEPYEIRQVQFLQGSMVGFISGVVTPVCRSCGAPFRFDVRFELADLNIPHEEAVAKVVDAIQEQYERDKKAGKT